MKIPENAIVFNEKTQEWVSRPAQGDWCRIQDNTFSWVRIGRQCSSNRRSIWARRIAVPPASGEGALCTIAYELCGGREGDDSYVIIPRDNPVFEAFEGIMNDAFYALTTLVQDAPQNLHELG